MTDVRVEGAYVEALVRGTVAVTVDASYVEALLRGSPLMTIDAHYIEVVTPSELEYVPPVDEGAFTGWGIPRI